MFRRRAHCSAPRKTPWRPRPRGKNLLEVTSNETSNILFVDRGGTFDFLCRRKEGKEAGDGQSDSRRSGRLQTFDRCRDAAQPPGDQAAGLRPDRGGFSREGGEGEKRPDPGLDQFE